MPSRSDSRSGDNLGHYRAKRRASATPEPFANGALAPAPKGVGSRRLFVVQQHAATHLHWDFRLEVDNVLRSWAVPKGPSLNPDDKRFAALVEDHPLDYAHFEGTIPDGNYGAGHVIVWDQGTYTELEDFDVGFPKGKLLFELHGHKLHGRWTLIRLKRRENTGKEWLLIKERDGQEGEESPADDSVLSGLTLETLAQPEAPQTRLHARLKRITPKLPETASLTEEPMLASSSEPFRRDGWVYEIKYDGYRMMIERDGDFVTLRSRRGVDLTERFPEIARSAGRLPYEEFAIDGEVVVTDDRGVPSFSRLQERARLRGERAIRRASNHDPVRYYAFDLLHAVGLELKSLPLVKRKQFLREMLPSAGPIRYSEHVEGDGVQTYEAMVKLGLEGVVGKRADSPYRGGRNDDWLKVRAQRTSEFVIAGWAPVKSNPDDVGALAAAEYRGETLVFCGGIGAGFGEAVRRELRGRLAELEPAPPLTDLKLPQAFHWVEPALVCEVEFKEYTRDGFLRHAVFLRLRDDKAPEECQSSYDDPIPAPFEAAPTPEVTVTNRDKVFFPEKGLTKGDLVDYYDNIAEWMLPYLADRPLVLTRFPDGIYGKSFYQRDAPAFTPDWVRLKTLWSDSAEREVNYFIVDDAASLRYLANMGAIPIHAWHSRVADLEHPDWCVLDLDPKSAPFADVVQVARDIRDLLAEVELPGFLKTSGASGLHILLPLANQLTHDQSRTLGELLARVIVSRRGDISTVARAVRARNNKVYIDFMQNGHGHLLVLPFSARAEPAASVSMPLEWEELEGELSNSKHHIENAPSRMRERGDPMRSLLDTEPDLARALALLGAL